MPARIQNFQKMHNSINYKIGEKIGKIIDFFHFPFRKICTAQFFRYGVCGASNTVFSWVLYWFFYNFVYQEQVLDLGFIAFEPHTAPFFTQLPITFMTGFWLSRYVSFSESQMRGSTQIFRYLLIVISCISMNYFGLKFFVEVCGFWATPSQMLNTLITTIFSFFMQKYFTFKA